MAGDSDEFVLASSHEETFIVPVPADHFLGVFSHSWYFPLVFLVVEVEIALLVATSQNWVGERPAHPGKCLFLIIEGEFVDHAGGEGSPEEQRGAVFHHDGEKFLLVIPIESGDSSFEGEFFFDECFSAFVDDVDVPIAGADGQIGGVLAPSHNRSFASVLFLTEAEDLLARGHLLILI